MSVLVSQAVIAQVVKSTATGVVTPPAAGTIPVADGAGKAQWLPAAGGGVTLASAGSGESIVVDGIGPILTVKGFTASTGLSLATIGDDIEFTNASPASSVSLTSDGGTESLVVAPGTGPGLHVKGLTAGAGVTLTGAAGAVTVTNASPASSVSLTSDGGTETLVVAPGTGPGLHMKGLTAGTGVTLTGAAGAVTVTNASPASSVSLISDGGTESLVVAPGTGPGLHVKGLTAGTGVTLTGAAGAVTVTNASPASSVSLTSDGGTESLVVAPGTGPGLHVKGLTAGAGVTLTGAAGAVTVTNASPASSVSLTSDGGTETLVVAPGTGPGLHMKGLTAGTGVTLTGAAGAVTVTNASPASSVSLISDGGTESLVVAPGTGPGLHVKGLTAGTGVTLTGAAGAVTVTNASPASSVSLTSDGGTESLVVAPGTGPGLHVKGLTAGTGVTLTGSAGAVAVGASQTAVLLPIAAASDAASPLAPAGQRDSWQSVGAAGRGLGLIYNSSANVVLSFAQVPNTPWITTSTDGGVTQVGAVFDINPLATNSFVCGSNSTVTCALGQVNLESYTSANALNFVKGAAPPALCESFNIIWFAAAGLFLAGCPTAGTRIMTSPDGVTWTQRVSTIPALTFRVNSSIAVAVGSGSPFAQWSTDGVTWTNVAAPISSARALAWSTEIGEFVTMGVSDRVVRRSEDGKTWTATGITAPVACNDALQWIASLGRYYFAATDVDGNYSLWTSRSSSEQFVGTHLDGAINLGANYALVFLSNYSNRFLIANNNSPYITYSTASTRLKALSDDITVRGAPASVDKFSAYADVTVNNTAVETTISAPASSLGSYTFQDSQPLGMKWVSQLVLIVSSVGGDTLTVRYKIGGVTKHTVAIAVTAGAASLPIRLECTATVRSATLELNSVLNVSGAVAVLANTAGGAYTRTVLNALSLTAQWGGSASSCTVADQSLRVMFMNGQP